MLEAFLVLWVIYKVFGRLLEDEDSGSSHLLSIILIGFIGVCVFLVLSEDPKILIYVVIIFLVIMGLMNSIKPPKDDENKK